MTWEEINNKILELNEQIQSFSEKRSSIMELAKIIKARQQKLDNNEDIKNLNNAVLENKMQVTPIQTLLLMKLNELSLSEDMNEIYINIPDSLEECGQFLDRTSKQYQFGENIITLVEKIEILSEIEYSNDSSFEETEYGKLIIFEDNILKKMMTNQNIDLLIALNNTVLIKPLMTSTVNTVKEYISTLPLEKKRELFLQTIQLSYNKNAFIFFQEGKTTYNIRNDIKIRSQLFILYNLYHQLLKNSLLEHYNNMPIEELLHDFDIEFINSIAKGQKNKK